jgi:hypothetical protein
MLKAESAEGERKFSRAVCVCENCRGAGYLEKRDRVFRVMGMSLRVGDTATA